MTYKDILKNMEKFKTLKFSSDSEAAETLLVYTHDALRSLLQKLSENEK